MSELENLRECGRIHRNLKDHLKTYIKPGMKVIDLVEYIENNIKKSIKYDGNHIKSGVAFPTGISINNCAAHWTPELSDNRVISEDDILKVDFGIHKNGYIIDSAFTHSFSNKYDALIESTREANSVAIKNSGIDAILSDIGKEVKEVIESYELELNNKIYPLKPVIDLTGHSIARYNIHSGKSVPNIAVPFYRERMKYGEIYAIEPFATTGTGRVKESGFCSHYMISKLNLQDKRLSNDDKKYIRNIYKKYLSLPFCTRWLEKENIDCKPLKSLARMNIINRYPPLYDIENSLISQHENTIRISEKNKVEILS